MAHLLEKKIAAVRRRVWCLVWVYGLGWIVALFVGASLVLGGADYLLHFQDPGVRAICTLTLLGIFVWSCYRYLVFGFVRRLRDVDIAQRIEQRFPWLKDRLSSSIEFLKQTEDHPEDGSLALRRTVILETASELEPLDFSEALERRPAIRSMLLALFAVLLGSVVVFLDPTSTGRAAARLINPFAENPWPQVNHLAFKNPPTQLAEGKTFAAELIDQYGAELPDELRIYYSYADGENKEEKLLKDEDPSKFINGVLLSIDKVTRSFSYRAEGGDDRSMKWLPLEVLQPPKIESFEVTLHPPKYTGWPETKGEKRIVALEGTRIGMSGILTKKVHKAELLLQKDLKTLSKDDSNHWDRIEASLDNEHKHFSISSEGTTPLVVKRSQAYKFALYDVEHPNLIGGAETQWNIIAITDRVPSVTFEQPTSDLFVTSNAVVPLTITVKDDIATHKIHLRFYLKKKGEKENKENHELLLWERSQEMERHGDHQLVKKLWDLTKIKLKTKDEVLELKPGDEIVIEAVATDFKPQPKNSKTPRLGKSQERRIWIITSDELVELIASRQTAILNELDRALTLQKETRKRTNLLDIQLQKVGWDKDENRFNDINQLHGMLLNQVQITHRLTGPVDGILAKIDAMLQILKNNKVDNSDIERRMHNLSAQIKRLRNEHLLAIEREFTNAHKKAQAHSGKEPSILPAVRGSLKTTMKHQDAVIDTLERLKTELTPWNDYRRFYRDIYQVLRDQEKTHHDTQEIRWATFSKTLNELKPQQLANLKKIATRQTDLARQFENILQRMKKMAAKTELQEAEPLAVQTLRDAINRANGRSIISTMLSASRNVEKNQVGKAITHQEQIISDLKKVLDILANRREHELVRLVEKLLEAGKEIKDLGKQQEALRKKFEKTEKIDNEKKKKLELKRLGKEQQKLQEKADRIARRLKRLGANRAGQRMGDASSSMGRAGSASDSGDASGAQQQSRDAEEDLERARQLVIKLRRQKEWDLAQEQLVRLKDLLINKAKRQKAMLEETTELDKTTGARSPRSSWGRSVKSLARRQNLLKVETEELARKIAAVEVFHLQLDRAAGQMGRAADGLAQRHTDQSTQSAQQNALNRMEQLLEALEPPKGGKNPGNPGPSGQGGQGGGGGSIRSLAELKLIMLMQKNVLRQLSDLEKSRNDSKQPTEEQLHPYSLLGEEQALLTELIFKFSKPEQADPEDDIENLPDASKEETLRLESPDELGPSLNKEKD